MPAVENSTDVNPVEESREHGEAGGATTPASPPRQDDPALADFLSEARANARQGSAMLTHYLAKLDLTDYERLGNKDELKATAKAADKERAGK